MPFQSPPVPQQLGVPLANLPHPRHIKLLPVPAVVITFEVERDWYYMILIVSATCLTLVEPNWVFSWPPSRPWQVSPWLRLRFIFRSWLRSSSWNWLRSCSWGWFWSCSWGRLRFSSRSFLWILRIIACEST